MVGQRTLTPSVQVRVLVPQDKIVGYATTYYILRGGEVVSRRAHNPKMGGSIPSPATK